MSGTIGEFHYRLRRPVSGLRPGAHPGRQLGAGERLHSFARLIDSPDPRRIDVRASLADPRRQWLVRTAMQRASTPVHVVADLSASMSGAGGDSKLASLAEFCRSVAFSAVRYGDSFGFVGCDDRLIDDLYLPATRARGAALAIADRIRAWQPRGDATALADAAEALTRGHGLVFLVSDFHFDDVLLDRILVALGGHDVVPVVLWDDAEWQRLPRRGLVSLRDPESGARRLLWMRPRLADAIAARYRARRDALTAMLRRHELAPFVLTRPFDADRLTGYFFGEAG